ncbi:glucoside xylosyltransferase 1 [Nephila pilipes]|uniref:UDP-D-xylose:beta-D-glucoside alpha-1,3-D-xylosyltransferase n=1 Tax=Nephila pilipes TaxID=299642 RepID=A0A8X6MMW7_NEPPI|nr:glucoside xylosyltransferase 1 [Nephila pilipes]
MTKFEGEIEADRCNPTNKKDTLNLKSRALKKYYKQNKVKISDKEQNSTVKDKIKVVTTHKKKIGKYDGKVYRFGSGTEEIKIAAVLCGERLNQTLVTLKSAQVFSKESLHFILIVDENNHEILKTKILEWPNGVLDRLSFEIHPINFPEGNEGEEWKKLFKLCACQRLFLPSLLHHIDSLMYVDTDVLFMQPVENLWHHFSKMNNSHLAALCPEHEDFATGWYNRFARHPYYEPLGVNSGVMLMNLTKMRAFQWEKYLAPIMKEYKLNIVWGDQDIINIIFHFHAEKLYILPCEWNYRPDHCMYSSVCKTAEKNGVAVIHGNRGVFHNDKQPAFKAIFKTMSQFNLEEDIQHKVLELIASSLKETVTTNCGKHLSAIFSKMEQLGKLR